MLQATVCLCERDTCNGPSLPPREMVEDEEHIIDIDEVFREFNSEPKEPQPEAVSGGEGAAWPGRGVSTGILLAAAAARTLLIS